MGAGKREYAGGVVDLRVFDGGGFLGALAGAKERGDGFARGSSLSVTQDVAGVESVAVRKRGPGACDGRGGVDERAVEVDQQRVTGGEQWVGHLA